MTDQLQKSSNLTPVSFDTRREYALTKGQKLLLQLLSDRLKDGSPISKRDICEVYIKSCIPSGTRHIEKYIGWDGVKSQYAYVQEIMTPEHWYVQKHAPYWFRQNLGSCIIKGKLLAIPVIEINE